MKNQIKSNNIAEARQIIKQALERDKGFRIGFVANVSCLLHDNLEKKDIAYYLLRHNEPVTWEMTNTLAEKIIDLLFH